MVKHYSFDLEGAVREQIAKELKRIAEICQGSSDQNENIVAIKDFRMPSACFGCPLICKFKNKYVCRVTGSFAEQSIKEERMPDCPLIEVKK